jgi:hypothetical protein
VNDLLLRRLLLLLVNYLNLKGQELSSSLFKMSDYPVILFCATFFTPGGAFPDIVYPP